jgi:hypothetical protein
MTGNTHRSPTDPRAVLIVGVHREELAFGDRVAERLDRSRIAVMRIPEGLPARRPSQEDAFYYTTTHRELYLQILAQVRGRYELVIDLHSGINESGCCADLFSADRALLDCACTAAAKMASIPGTCTPPVRPILLGETAPVEERAGRLPLLRAHTVIPEPVWSTPGLVYLGLEVFVPVPDSQDPDDLALARNLIESLLDCASGSAEHLG